MSTFTAGNFSATVKDGNYVDVYRDGILIDNPGPWDTLESATLWAEAIVGKLYADSQTPPAPTE